MAWVIADRTKETTATTGTGDLTFGGAVAGFFAFSTVCADGDVFPYAIENGANSETGIGTYHSGANSFTRSPLTSTNSGALVNLPAQSTVAIDLLAALGSLGVTLCSPPGDTVIPENGYVLAKEVFAIASGKTLYIRAGGCLEIAPGPQAFPGYKLTGLIAFSAAASGTYTPSTGTRAILVECIGGGGAGGSSVTGATATSAAPGGGGGAQSIKWVVPVDSSYQYTVGAGGTPGAAGNNPGGAGGDTFLGTVCYAKGASGGLGGGVAGTGPAVISGAVGGDSGFGPPVAGDLLVNGGAGGYSIVFSATQAISGNGGATVRGALTPGRANTSLDGLAGANEGGGGGGAISLNGGASHAGGAGASGVILIWEYA